MHYFSVSRQAPPPFVCTQNNLGADCHFFFKLKLFINPSDHLLLDFLFLLIVAYLKRTEPT